MNQGAPWSVKGIDSETRETAKVLARRSGMTLGQWLQNMISSQNESASSLFRDVDSDDPSPLAAIARRLEKGERWYQGNPARGQRRDEAAVGVSVSVLARHIRTSEARMADLIERVMRRQEEGEVHLAALVDAIVDGFVARQAETGKPPPSRATPHPPSGSIPADWSPEDLECRIAAMARVLEATAKPELQPLPSDGLSKQIVGLTREIAELRRTNFVAADKQNLTDVREDIAALSQRIDEMAPRGQFAQIDRKLDLLARQAQDPTLLASIQRETADIRTRLDDLARQPDTSQRLERKLDALQLAVADVQASSGASLSALMARLEALDAQKDDEAALTGLEQQISGMARTIDGLGKTLGQANPALPDLQPAFQAAFAQSPLQALPEELQRLYRELRSLQEGEGRESQKALGALHSLLHQVASRLTAVEDLVRARITGSPISGPPGFGEMPPLFGRERQDESAWSQDLPRSLAGDVLFQPKVEDGPVDDRPSQVSALGQAGPAPAGGARSSFIAAARRAARAAAEAEGNLLQENDKPGGSNEPFYKRHKRAILLGLAAVTMMMGALQAGRVPNSTDGVPKSVRTAPAGVPRKHPDEKPELGAMVRQQSSEPSPRDEGVSLFEEARQLDAPNASTLDLTKAAGLYRQAAQLGYAPALFLLGLAYDKGRGVGRDAMLAGLWYQRAAEHGSVKAMYNLAVLYAGGSVMGAPDYKQAARWFHQAAELGHAASQYNYALLAAQGLGTRRDLATSYRFLAQAAAKGDLEALSKLSEVAPRLTSGERAQIDNAARGT